MASPARIVVVGSANVDLTTFVDEFPRPGETVFARRFVLGFGGKGANQAVAARLCGAEVEMVARVGTICSARRRSTTSSRWVSESRMSVVSRACRAA